MWERERTDEVLQIASRAGIKKFRIARMDGSAWDMNKKEFIAAVTRGAGTYLMYRVYVEDYAVFLEIMTY